jgi:hypothetical protein
VLEELERGFYFPPRVSPIKSIPERIFAEAQEDLSFFAAQIEALSPKEQGVQFGIYWHFSVLLIPYSVVN